MPTGAHLWQVSGDSCALSPDYANDSMRQSVQIIQPFSLIRAPAMTGQQETCPGDQAESLRRAEVPGTNPSVVEGVGGEKRGMGQEELT